MAANMSLEEEMKRLREQNLQLTQKNTQLTQKTTQLTQKTTQLTQKNTQLTQKNTQLTQKNTQLTQENQQMTPLTFTKLLTLCHEHFKEVPVEPNPSNCTTGSVGNSKDKFVPLALRAWTEFPSLQESTFRKVSAIYDQCKQPPATFPSSYTISNSRGMVLASELDLRRQQADRVEDIFEVVIRDLIRERKPPSEFKLGTDIQVDNYANNLTQDEKKMLAKWADKIFIRRVDGDARRLVVIIEYKPPHKLSIETLKAGLKDLDPLDLVHRVKIPKEEAAKFVHDSEKAVATVISQVYTYMIDNGIQYAYMTTGQAFVFLYTHDQDRNILYYHLSIPKDASLISCSAIGQVISFYILACGGKSYDHDTRKRHQEEAGKWSEDEDKLVDNMTPPPQRPPTPSSNYKVHKKRHAPAHSQSRISRRPRASTSGETPAVAIRAKKDDSDDPPDGDDGRAPSNPFAPTSTRASRLSKGTSSQSITKDSQTHTETSGRKRYESYCSHQCLLGLVTNGALDRSCPNYKFHPRIKKGGGKERHAISVVQLHELLLAQIQKSMNTNIEPLGIQGSRGAIFKLTLESHGYTIIGKGTPPHYVPDLRMENAVYDHLHEIQGMDIPVCLGAIDSPRCYLYDVDVEIYHWLLMSFAGKSLSTAEFDARRPSVYDLQGKLREYGVLHRDISPNNFLWDEQAKKLMVIDLERVTLARGGKQTEVKEDKKVQDKIVLKAISPNKTPGKRKELERGANVTVKRARLRTQ